MSGLQTIWLTRDIENRIVVMKGEAQIAIIRVRDGKIRKIVSGALTPAERETIASSFQED